MTESLPQRHTGRTVGALLAGFFSVLLLSLGTDEVFHLLKVYPPWGEPMEDRLFYLATSYRLVYGIFGSYLAARLAPSRPMWHAMFLGYLGLAISILGAAATWNASPPLGPHWYPVALVVTAVPCAWLGGVLHRKTT